VRTPRRHLLFFLALIALAAPLAHAQGTVVASDNFNRPNESPFAITGNWGRTIAGSYDGNSSLVSNQVRATVKEGIYYWKGAGTFDPTRQYAKEKIVQKDGEAGLVLLGDAQGFAIQFFRGLGMPLPQQQLAFVPVQLRLKPALACSFADV